MAPLLRESVALASIAGTIGFVLAYVAVAWLSVHAISFGAGVPAPSFDVRPDFLVMAMAAALVFVVGIAIGLAPAWRAASDHGAGILSQGMRATERGTARTTGVMIAIQTAVTTAVLVGAAVAWRGVVDLERVDLGFSARDVAVTQIVSDRPSLSAAARRDVALRIRDAVAEVPGVQSASLAMGMPLDFCCDDLDVRPSLTAPAVSVRVNAVDDRFFSTMGIRIEDGRAFDAHDAVTQGLAVVNRVMARRLWPGDRAVGQRVLIGDAREPVTVIGVADDAKYEELDQPEHPLIYLDARQRDEPLFAVIARTSGNASAAAPAIARAITSIKPDERPWVRTMASDLDLQFAFPRLIFRGLGGLGVTALALTSVGLYGMVFYAVGRRRREIGIHVALGARPRDVLGLVLRRTLVFSVGGAIVGAAVSALALPLIASFFYGVSPMAPGLVVSVMSLSVIAAAIVATFAARRWTGISAMEILRAPQ
jgi:predicted permease